MVTIGRKTALVLALVLFASLAANVFVGGIAVGRQLADPARDGAWRWDRGRYGRAAEGVPPIVARMAGSLEPTLRDRFLGAVEAHRERMSEARGLVRAARRDIRSAMTAEPFDRSRLESAFAALRAANQGVQGALHGALADAIEPLPADARERLTHFRKRRPRP